MPRGIDNRDYPAKTCLICTNVFKPRTYNHKFCSESCKWSEQSNKPETRVRKAANHKVWSDANKDRKRDYHYKYNYGITLQKYEELKEAQNHKCAVCKRHESELKRKLAVDHDHKTREIFGLLCDYCNRQVIGKIRKPELFLQAAQYLKRGTGLFVPIKKKKRRKRRKPP